VAATSAASVVVLNSDAVADPRWLARLVEEADRSPRDVWAWGTVLLRPDGLVESAGDQYSPEGRAYKLGTGARHDDLPQSPYEVFAPPGAAPLFRRDVFDDLGGYCERFFLYYEDVDLAFRARLRGHRAVMVPTATVTHDQGTTSRRQPSRASWFIARNSLWCAVRNLPSATSASMAKVSLREARWARSKGGLRPFVAGRAAGVAGLPWALRERRRIQAARVVDDAAVASFLDEPPALAGVVATHAEGSR
jgi:GT2 family glycosyltransferase